MIEFNGLKDADFHFFHGLVHLRAGRHREALESIVRALLLTRDEAQVQRSVAVVARLNALLSARAWVYLAYGAIRARALGDAARERRFLLAAMRVAPEEASLEDRLARLDETRPKREVA